MDYKISHENKIGYEKGYGFDFRWSGEITTEDYIRLVQILKDIQTLLDPYIEAERKLVEPTNQPKE